MYVAQFQTQVYALDHFDAWVQDHFTRMATATRKWTLEMLDSLELAADTNSQLHLQIKALIPQMRAVANNLAISQINFYPTLP